MGVDMYIHSHCISKIAEINTHAAIMYKVNVYTPRKLILDTLLTYPSVMIGKP